MTQHPITPPPELAAKWVAEIYGHPAVPLHSITLQLVERAAQWGADAELEACCEWINSFQNKFVHAHDLRLVRRPKPPSLKEQALDELHIGFDRGYLKEGAADTIRRALEALPE
jgi:hypothetical protein